MNGVEVFVPLTKGYVATIDIEDWDNIRPYKWQAFEGERNVYASRSAYSPTRRTKTIFMHRTLLEMPRAVGIDHKNGNGLDNRRDNLRAATCSQNGANQKIRSSNTSGFKGAYWKKDNQAWRARICVNYKDIHLGYFSTAEEAARAYDTAAQQYFGEFAKLNFPNR